jgi:hypothetical protein
VDNQEQGKKQNEPEDKRQGTYEKNENLKKRNWFKR